MTGTITIAMTGTGVAGVVLVNLTQGVTGQGTADSTPIQVAYTQTGAVASVQIFSTDDPPCRDARALARCRRF